MEKVSNLEVYVQRMQKSFMDKMFLLTKFLSRLTRYWISGVPTVFLSGRCSICSRSMPMWDTISVRI